MVVMVETYTFSALMRQVVEFEKKLGDVAKKVAEEYPDIKILRELAEDSNKNARTLEKLMRETVVEMTLEPITGIDLERMMNELKKMDDNAGLDEIPKLSSTLSDFYVEISSKIRQMSAETSMYLKKVSRKRKRVVQTLEKEIERA